MNHIQAVLRHSEEGFYGKYIGDFYADQLANDAWRKLQASEANYVIVRTELAALNIVRFNEGLPVYGEPLTAHAWVVSPEGRSEQHVELLQRWYLAGSPCSLDSRAMSYPDKVLRDIAGGGEIQAWLSLQSGFFWAMDEHTAQAIREQLVSNRPAPSRSFG